MLILFDLDGVILDSKDCMAKSWLAVQEQYNISIPFSSYFQNIGRPFFEILSIIGVQERHLYKEIQKLYVETSGSSYELMRLYPDAKSTLEQLKHKHSLGIVTSKSLELTSKVLQRFDLDNGLFNLIVCPEHLSLNGKPLAGKPLPDPLLYSMLYMGHSPRETVFVGDMEVDATAAYWACTPFIFAEWGYGADHFNYPCIHASSFKILPQVISDVFSGANPG